MEKSLKQKILNNIKQNYKIINENIAKLQNKIGKKDCVKIIAVTKTISLPILKLAIMAGIKDFGENRPQELLKKITEIGNNKINWHMIGHLQTNKIKLIADKVKLIQSVDSLRLAEKLNSFAKKNCIKINILLEIKTSDEPQKHGFLVKTILSDVEKIAEFDNLKILGLMTIAPFTKDETKIRNSFSTLRNLFEKIQKQNLPNFEMKWRSYGMTDDYKLAVLEGSNMVRIGRGIFNFSE